MHLGGDPEAAEVALVVPDEQGAVLEVRHQPLGVGQRDDVVGVAVPPPDRCLDVVRLEAPVAGEEDPVGDERPHAAPAVLGEVVEEHLLHVRAGEHLPIAGRREAGVELERLRAQRLEHAHERR